ncbi:MAG: recombinase RecT [Acidimicrobiales bacterium]|jgi:recombination protein RecT|nr:recombinase RecT [Acidimicrobiales bacterium]
MAAPKQSLADAAKGAASGEPTSAVVPKAPEPPSIVKMLESPAQLEELRKALPPGLSVERFARMALTLVKSDPEMLELGSTPEGTKSLITAFHRCAQLGLEVGPDLGQAYLLPFRMRDTLTLQFILGYKGILTMARRSGALRRLDVHEVYQNDEFEYSYGLNGTLHHRPTLEKDRGPIICYYGFAEFTDGGYYYTVLTLDDIDSRKQRSASVKAGRKSPWDTDPIAMSKKTVVRAMAPYLPLSVEAQDAIADDEKMVVGDQLSYIDVGTVDHTPMRDTQEPVQEVIEVDAGG